MQEPLLICLFTLTIYLHWRVFLWMPTLYSRNKKTGINRFFLFFCVQTGYYRFAQMWEGGGCVHESVSQCACAFLHINVRVYVDVYACARAYIYIYIYIIIYIYVCVCLCVCAPVCVCTCVCVCVWLAGWLASCSVCMYVCLPVILMNISIPIALRF